MSTLSNAIALARPIAVCECAGAYELALMSFAEPLDNMPLQKSPLVRRFEQLIAPKSDAELESMARTSRVLTLQNFGRTMRLFAPLYLSNECINNCRYCGFSRDNPILRVTLNVEEVVAEARYLRDAGFRQILLVAGEHPKFVSGDYLAECVRALAPDFPSIAIEVGPMASSEYVPIIRAGAEGLVVYQETYQRSVYAELHTAGPKRDFNYRLDCPERAYNAGFRRLGIGALFGLWRRQDQAVALAAHVDYLLRRCWQAQITISLPRLRPAAGGFRPLFSISDRELAQLVCALRISFPQVGIVLSTRERAALRDALVALGVTMMSAGSHTEPGGDTLSDPGQCDPTGCGRVQPPELQDGEDQLAHGQFEISDDRAPARIATIF